jgi:hypothetical protein
MKCSIWLVMIFQVLVEECAVGDERVVVVLVSCC